jgi:hypothetical protein
LPVVDRGAVNFIVFDEGFGIGICASPPRLNQKMCPQETR